MMGDGEVLKGYKVRRIGQEKVMERKRVREIQKSLVSVFVNFRCALYRLSIMCAVADLDQSEALFEPLSLAAIIASSSSSFVTPAADWSTL